MTRAIALFLVAFAAATARAMPAEIVAEYQLSSVGVVIGRVNEAFERRGDTYSISSITRSEGVLKIVLDDSITLQSEGRVVATGLQPLVFKQRRASRHDKDILATFDWDKGIMHAAYDGQEHEVALPAATQDRISILYQFMNIAERPRVITMPMSNGRKVEYYTYRFVDEVKLTTPAGDFQTLHYERVNADPKESKAQVWLAKDRFNLPVRVVFDDQRGLRLEQNLVALRTQ
ncbi:MAG: DUF3108 domain-containing protein [Bacillota bacterium]